MEVTLKDGKLTLVLDVHEAKLSASGKTYLVAGTHGLRFSGVSLDGEPVWVLANAFVYPNPGHAKVSSKKTDAQQKSKK